MPSKKYEWSAIDYSAASYIDEILTNADLGNREIDRITNSAITYARVRDIRNALKAPVRLSEFILLCTVAKVDLVASFKEVLDAAERLENEQRSQTTTTTTTVNDDVPLTADGEVDYTELTRRFAPEELGLAAYRDPNKYIESQTPTD